MLRATMMVLVFLNICSLNSMDVVDMNSDLNVRTFGLKFSHNKQDEDGNTFWHQLALGSNQYTDWNQILEQQRIFKQNNNNWLPNPFICNNKGRTAKEEAKINFEKTGHPLVGFLVFNLKEAEKIYLTILVSQSNREAMKKIFAKT